MFTYLDLLVFTYVYHCLLVFDMFKGACLPIVTPFYLCLPIFTLVDLCLLEFTYVYLLTSTCVYLCLPLFT